MVAYRFCRSDDIPVLVDGFNRCWRSHFPRDRRLDQEGLKRWIRDVQLWTSSSMLAADDDGPIGVLLGCRRNDATLLWRLAIHPRYQRQGHARHLLSSLSSKLAILGPPILRVELPESRPELSLFFSKCGYSPGETSADFELASQPPIAPPALIVPFSVDDLLANEVFDDSVRRSWQRGLPSLEAKRSELRGLAIASFEEIEAFLLVAPGDPAEIVSFGYSESERLPQHFLALLAAWISDSGPKIVVPKVTPKEIPFDVLERAGFVRREVYRTWEIQASPA